MNLWRSEAQTFMGRVLVPSFLWGALTAASLIVLFQYVSLKPRVDEHFFFSSEDPQFQADKEISRLFPLPPQIILSAKGDIRSPEYSEKVESLTERLSALPHVAEVQSMTRGPGTIYDALQSPLWKRIILSRNEESTFLFVNLEDVPAEEIIPGIEAVKERFDSEDFRLMISGAPYIVELIRRHLLRDMQVFSLAAFCIFGVTLLLIFHSGYILLGTLLASVNAGAVTLILSKLLGMEIGPLTANLSTIVFVLTLSHMVFMTFNFRSIQRERADALDAARKAVRVTLVPSFWSMFTTVLGFVSLIFVEATPLRQLGISGAVGTFVAFAAAYGVYPFFLRMEALRFSNQKKAHGTPTGNYSFYEKIQGWVVAVLIIGTGFVATGVPRLNADPSLFSYFKGESEIRQGMEYIDRNGGSVPLMIVIADEKGRRFRINHVYGQLWRLHEALEEDPAVGSILSIPVILAEAKRRVLTFLLPPAFVLSLIDNPQFITDDRTKTLFLFRMNEEARDASRTEIVERLETTIREHGLVPVLVGGIYLLQGKLTALVMSSLVLGLVLLVVVFCAMGFMLSYSLQVAFAMLVSLCIIPLAMLGALGHLGVPVDIISAPAVNVGMAMGVDAMIHVLIFARRHASKKTKVWETWDLACARLWKPILSNMVVVSVGFGVFGLSTFPPTQRFGFAVVMGTLIAPFIALFVLPCLSTITIRKKV